VAEASHSVFLSYASQDAEAAQRICEALRAAGIEVWFDQSALRGGDVWDQTIRKQIKACALFIPVISRHTHDRIEGYFRLEWKLAIDRSHLIASDQTFLLPVVIDDTREDDERVPDRFKEIHWTRLPGGETSSAFVQRVRRLVSPEPSHAPMTGASPAGPISTATPAVGPTLSWPQRALPAIVAVVVLGALAYFAVDKFSKYPPSPPTPPATPAGATPAAFSPPPHSIAVLPFVNMSGDKQQEYFSDGLSEELLNSLSRINELQVAARTSSFYFKGKEADLATIAHKLNVASVLEGSVRRSGHTIRVTAQLNNAVSGYHLWSETYDRDLKDVLKLQTEIATAVANALKLTLLGDLTAKIEAGGTNNPAAFDAYVRALKAHYMAVTVKEEEAAIDLFTQAVRLDPDYALAYASRSISHSNLVLHQPASAPIIRASLDRALADARKTIAMAPALADGHLALATVYEALLDFTRADEAYELALRLAPSNARVLRDYGSFTVYMGRSDSGLTMLQRAAALDPLNHNSHFYLGIGLRAVRRYHEAIVAFSDSLALVPDAADVHRELAVTQYLLGDFKAARSSCEKTAEEYSFRHQCLAMAYRKLGRHADAEAALAKAAALWGDSGAALYAEVHAQWGNAAKALDCLDTALRLHDPGLEGLKTDPLLDPLRNEPRFQAIERALKFPG
jgi:TolB-like protein/Tfp pilus assembly protein PilF